jgi:hypothetical protein
MTIVLSMLLAHSLRNSAILCLPPAKQVSVLLFLMQWNVPFNVCCFGVTVSNVTDLNCIVLHDTLYRIRLGIGFRRTRTYTLVLCALISVRMCQL